MRIGLKLATMALTVIVLASTLRISYSLYCSWSLTYTGGPTGHHLSETINPPVYSSYRFTATGQSGTCKTKISFNGVEQYLYSAGSVTTFSYYGVSSPSITLSLQDYPSGTPASMSGTLEVGN